MQWLHFVIQRPESSKVEIFFVVVYYFLGACFFTNTLGRAITANKKNVRSLICFLYLEKQYLGVSGDGDLFEVFNVLKLKANEFLSKFFASYVFAHHFK